MPSYASVRRGARTACRGPRRGGSGRPRGGTEGRVAAPAAVPGMPPAFGTPSYVTPAGQPSFDLGNERLGSHVAAPFSPPAAPTSPRLRAGGLRRTRPNWSLPTQGGPEALAQPRHGRPARRRVQVDPRDRVPESAPSRALIDVSDTAGAQPL